MNVTVTQSKFSNLERHGTGGAYATTVVDIQIDETLPLEERQHLVIHEILEAYTRTWAHGAVDELCAMLSDGLGQL